MTPHALAGTLISHAAGLTSNAAAAECRRRLKTDPLATPGN
jgi:hypothetical protein